MGEPFVIQWESEAQARAALAVIAEWTSRKGLSLQPDKTRISEASQSGEGSTFWATTSRGTASRAGDAEGRKTEAEHRPDRGLGDLVYQLQRHACIVGKGDL